MLKQFLSKLPRKLSKSDSSAVAKTPADSPLSGTPFSQSNSRAGFSGSTGGLEGSKLGCGGGGGNPSFGGRNNSSKRISAAVFPASTVAGIEPMVPFKDVPAVVRMNLFISN